MAAGGQAPKDLPVLWVDGVAYDITDHQHWHPGGDIIEQFLGRDATTVFFAMHPPSAFKWLRARRAEPKDAPAPPKGNAALREGYKELHAKFSEQGWLEPSMEPLLKNLGCSAFFMSLALFCPWDGTGRLPPTILGLFAGMAFHQLAFTVHDLMHGGVVGSKALARRLGVVLGDLGFGVLSGHWDDEHIAHHVMSNCIDHDFQQRNAPLITVDQKQLTEKQERIEVAPNVEQWLLRVNHWFWLLAATWGGRFALQIVGVQWVFAKPKERAWQISLLVAHYYWLSSLMCSRSQAFPVVGGVALGPWFSGLITYLVAGLLHIQLLMNHASRPMTAEKDDARAPSEDWISWQVAATADISCPTWMDWFHGGLQFQITHHLFPRLRADRLRPASREVYAMLEKHKQPVYIFDGMSGGIAAVTRQLATACKEAGHKPWFLGAGGLQTPNVFWVCLHFGLLVMVPLCASTDGWYFGLWLAAFGFFLCTLFSPLAGLA